MSELRIVGAGTHDLPPRWDGRRVEWGGWDAARAFICPPPKGARCERCGTAAPCMTSAGVVRPLPGEMFDSQRTKRTRSGREYVVAVEVPAWPVLRLHATRCTNCHHDMVWDEVEDEWWDLDPSDYLDDGSTDPRLL